MTAWAFLAAKKVPSPSCAFHPRDAGVLADPMVVCINGIQVLVPGRPLFDGLRIQ